MAGDSQTQVSVYRVRVRFERLFADPVIFEDPLKLVQRYLALAGVPSERLGYMQQTAGEIVPVDDSGSPSVVSGTSSYPFHGKRARSEFMAGANLSIEYADFGSGLSPEEHEGLWKRGLWGEMRFQVKSFHHETVAIELPDPDELYEMLHERANPTTFASVKLANIPETLFLSTANYLEQRLSQLSEKANDAVEVYAARNLTPEERRALEKRIAQESNSLTVYVILSRRAPTS
jgi:hypothetical protein